MKIKKEVNEGERRCCLFSPQGVMMKTKRKKKRKKKIEKRKE
jgi:hypothetical protein